MSLLRWKRLATDVLKVLSKEDPRLGDSCVMEYLDAMASAIDTNKAARRE